jgi:hypothetical protein
MMVFFTNMFFILVKDFGDELIDGAKMPTRNRGLQIVSTNGAKSSMTCLKEDIWPRSGCFFTVGRLFLTGR